MTENEKLIEEANHLVEQAGSFREQAGAAASPTSMIGLWLRTADTLAAVLAVFEKAHTPADDEQEPGSQRKQACEGFEWCGQSFKFCDRCGVPFWEHTHEKRSVGLVLISREDADAVKEKWDR